MNTTRTDVHTPSRIVPSDYARLFPGPALVRNGDLDLEATMNCKRCGRKFDGAKKLHRHRCAGYPKVLTLLGIPQHRVQNNRLVLHYLTKEFGWIPSAKYHALLRKGSEVRYAN